MQTLTVQPNITQDPKFKKFLARYAFKKGFQDDVLELPHDVIAELISGAIICYTAKDINIEEEFLINLTPSELTLKCYKQGRYDVSLDAEYMKQALDITDDTLIDSFSNPVNAHRLQPNEPFLHPLADSEIIDGQEVINGYAVACLIIDSIRHASSTHDNGTKAKDFFRRCILASGRPVNVEALLVKVQAGYLREILDTCNLINDGFSNMAESEKFI